MNKINMQNMRPLLRQARTTDNTDHILRNLKHDHWRVRLNSVLNPHFRAIDQSIREDAFLTLSQDSHEFVRQGLAGILSERENPVVQEIFNKLSKDPEVIVRESIARNRDCPIAVRIHLASDSALSVRDQIARNQNIPEGSSNNDIEIFQMALKGLAESNIPYIKRAASQNKIKDYVIPGVYSHRAILDFHEDTDFNQMSNEQIVRALDEINAPEAAKMLTGTQISKISDIIVDFTAISFRKGAAILDAMPLQISQAVRQEIYEMGGTSSAESDEEWVDEKEAELFKDLAALMPKYKIRQCLRELSETPLPNIASDGDLYNKSNILKNIPQHILNNSFELIDYLQDKRDAISKETSRKGPLTFEKIIHSLQFAGKIPNDKFYLQYAESKDLYEGSKILRNIPKHIFNCRFDLHSYLNKNKWAICQETKKNSLSLDTLIYTLRSAHRIP